MTISFLFWNVAKRDLVERVGRIVRHYDIDVVILAECTATVDAMLRALNSSGRFSYSFPFALGTKLRVFTRLPEDSITDISDNDLARITIRRINSAQTPELIVVAAHLVSKIHWSEADQAMECSRLAHSIEVAENQRGHQRTMLVGDLNMNPFEAGVVGAHGLHAVMTRADARRVERSIQGVAYRFFYNPMWGHFGDRSAGPPGTYYLKASKPINYFWNIYDQVLLRPALLESLTSLEIVDSDGSNSLVTENGVPDSERGSDHLPILFRLDSKLIGV